MWALTAVGANSFAPPTKDITDMHEGHFKMVGERRKEQFARSLASMDIRSDILHISLWMERVASEMLAELLNVKLEDSKLLGNTSKAISLDLKVMFLSELQAIDTEKRKRFQPFQEIRNQFAHNVDAYSMEKCLAITGLNTDKLLSWYPQPKERPLEAQYRQAVLDMGLDLVNTIEEVWEKIIAKRVNKFVSELDKAGLETYYKESARQVKLWEIALGRMDEPFTRAQAIKAVYGYAHFLREAVDNAIKDYPDTFKIGLEIDEIPEEPKQPDAT